MYFYLRFCVLSIEWSSLLAFSQFLMHSLFANCCDAYILMPSPSAQNQIMPQINNWPYRVRSLPCSTGFTRPNSARRRPIVLLHCKLMNSLLLIGIVRLRSIFLFFHRKMASYIFCMGTTYVIQDVIPKRSGECWGIRSLFGLSKRTSI